MIELLIIVFLTWNIVPFILLWRLDVPAAVRRGASRSFADALLRGLVILPADLLAPVVVPVALLGTKWEDDRLPRWARWWDNDVSINGDLREPDGSLSPVPVEDALSVEASPIILRNYWAKGHHPRSRWSRYVWLGWRNRASWLAMRLGRRFVDAPVRHWGDPATGNGHPGWTLNEHNGVYQLYIVRKLGSLQFRFNWGFKVWGGPALGRTYAPVVNITASLKRWRA